MSAKLWPYIEANKLLKQYGTEKTILFETGYGPSGLPHIGTFGEVVRTYFLLKALRELGGKGKIISFSDDLDGLRKIPKNMDSEFLTPHMGKPLSAIPDPYGCHGSYSEHMNQELIKMLDHIGVEYEFKSATEQYKSGVFNESIKSILSNLDKIESIVLPTLSPETRKGWFPYFQICENCGKLYTSDIESFDVEKMEVTYHCCKEFKGITSCDHRGTSSVFDGKGKFTWRVDWGLRWNALKINYELYGKDLIESANVSKKIVRAIGGKPPIGMFYELFLNEDGSKISKSVGDGVTLDQWSEYGNEDALKLFMFKKPTKAKRLYFEIIPQYMDELLGIQNAYYNNVSKDDTFKFLKFFNLDDSNPFPSETQFSTLCNLILAVGSNDKEIIKGYLFDENSPELDENQKKYIDETLELSINYAKKIMSQGSEIPIFDKAFENCFKKFIEFLSTEKESDEIHNSIYLIAKEEELEPKALFRELYHGITGQERGPRLGSFISTMGQKIIIDKLTTYMEK